MGARNLVVCCDGTWNTAEADSVTNVVKLYNALAENAGQLRYYQSGVGTTGGSLSWLAGGATGVGLSRDVKTAYHWVATHYKPGDRVWLFGFSRGAYTARSVAGMISCCGLVAFQENPWREIERLYTDFYRKQKKPEGLPFLYDPNVDVPAEDKPFPVHFIGVWDTVGSLGVPDNLGLLNLFDSPTDYQFHDVSLNEHVRHARHCLALDESRGPFTPTLWDHPNDARVKQVWFPGGHVDVGGGYAQTGLSDTALLWMISEASSVDSPLEFDKELVNTIQADPRAPIHEDNRTALAAVAPAYVTVEPILDFLFEPRPRAIPPLSRSNLHSRENPAGEVHASVFERQAKPFLQTGFYRPHKTLAPNEAFTFTVYAHRKWNAAGLYLEAGEYEFSASGQWRGFAEWSGPEGDKGFYLRRIPGAVLGAAERAFQEFAGNKAANFLLTRRVERAPWSCLIGVVANGRIKGSEYIPHDTFGIGASHSHVLSEPGYFYAFANDAPGAYNDNLGSVELRIERRK